MRIQALLRLPAGQPLSRRAGARAVSLAEVDAGDARYKLHVATLTVTYDINVP